MMGESAALFTAIIWAVGIFPFTQASNRMGAFTVNNFRLLLAALILSLMLILFWGLSPYHLFSLPSKKHWLWLGLSGLIGLTIGDYFSFSSFSMLGPRLSSIFATLAPAVVLVTEIAIGNESFSAVGMGGMLLTIAGIMISLGKKKGVPREQQSAKGILYAALAAVCQGLGIVCSKEAMGGEVSLEPAHAAWIRMVVSCGLAYLLVVFTGRIRSEIQPIRENRNQGLKYVLGGTLCGPVLGMTTCMYALAHIDASVAQTLFSLVPVFVIVISRIFFGQRISAGQLAGSLVATAGVFVLIWRDALTQIFL